ncbi:MAG: hypothetical protein PHQ73_13825, partial [Gallionella sp.]|nr:hypothetical protein [Gallionella sp.]
VIVLARIRERNFAPNKSPKINDPDSPSTSVSDGEGAVLKQGGVVSRNPRNFRHRRITRSQG